MICLACSATGRRKYIEAGPKEKSLSNLKAHVKTTKHNHNVMLFRESKNKEKQKDEAAEKDKIKKNALEEINKMHKGMFEELQNSSEECVRCCL